MKSDFEQWVTLTDKIKEQFEAERKELEERRKKLDDMELFSEYDPTYVNAFKKRPYVILPRKEQEWYLIVPKMFQLQVGFLLKSTDSYNVFVVNKYQKFLGGIPAAFEKIFKFKRPLPLKVFDGMLLTGEDYQDRSWERYKKHLLRREGSDRIRIKKGSEFSLIAELIGDGILPFTPHPVESDDLVLPAVWKTEPKKIALRRRMDFFKNAVKKFRETGAVGVYWAMSVGKTIFGLELLAMINVDNRPNLVISGKSASLREQWEEKIRDLINPAAPVEVQTYHSLHKVIKKKWGLVIFDECHHLPANTFSRMALLDAKYRAGLSATPYREDGRIDYIFALTGHPIGLDWKVLRDLGLIKAPDITLYLCRTYRDKQTIVSELLQDPMKTLIYSFEIDRGKALAKVLEVPFVYGETSESDRLDIIRNSQTTIVSSAVKEGISLQDIERTITYNFHFGSRQEETQFFGRLLHGDDEHKGYHYILMTDEEYEKYGKRLYGIEEKGFRIQVVRY